MSEINENEELLAQAEEAPAAEAPVEEVSAPEEAVAANPETAVAENEPKKKLGKKQMGIIGAIAAVVIIVVIIALIPSKFNKVKNECVHIAGQISSGKDYFTIDTYPDAYENMDETLKALLLPGAQENALEAIRYANDELGFPGSVYSQMMKTSALMGRQSEETGKYKVSWTYHPDDGLEVTYTKK